MFPERTPHERESRAQGDEFRARKTSKVVTAPPAARREA